MPNFLCAYRFVPAPKVQRASVEKKNLTASSRVAGALKRKKNIRASQVVLSPLSFSFAFSFLAFICLLPPCAILLLVGSNIILS